MEFNITVENENTLSITEAKFILEQAEKTLKETGDQSQIIVARTTTLIVLISGLLIGIMAFMVKEIGSESKMNDIMFVCILGSIYLFCLCNKMIANISGHQYYPLGTDPKTLFINDFFNAPNMEIRQVWFYITEIKRCQSKIEWNKNENEKRWKKFNNHLKYVTWTAPILIGLYGIIHLLLSFLQE